jgi:hypothetical protein
LVTSVTKPHLVIGCEDRKRLASAGRIHGGVEANSATPYHKNVAVHLAPVVGAGANAAEAASARVPAVAAAHVSAA